MHVGNFVQWFDGVFAEMKMAAWGRLCTKHRRFVAIKMIILVTVAGEAICLVKLGVLHKDYAGAYLIASTWIKDFMHKLVENLLSGNKEWG